MTDAAAAAIEQIGAAGPKASHFVFVTQKKGRKKTQHTLASYGYARSAAVCKHVHILVESATRQSGVIPVTHSGSLMSVPGAPTSPGV